MKIYSFCIFIICVISVQAWYTTIVVSGTTTIKTLPRSTSTTTTTTTIKATITPSPTLGCGELNSNDNVLGIVVSDYLISPSSCLSSCMAHGWSSTAYYSLSFANSSPYYFCFCYDSTYVLIPKTINDNNCTVIDGFNYGVMTENPFSSPNTVYL